MLCFTKANAKSLRAIKQIIHDFSTFSGLQVSLSKSSLTFSALISNRDELFNVLGFSEGKLPFKYLGVPITGRELRTADCQVLIDQLQTYLARWRNKCISYAG